MKLFGIHFWRTGPRMIKERIRRKVDENIFIEYDAERLETPKEYKSRKKNMVTVTLFGKQFTFKFRK